MSDTASVMVTPVAVAKVEVAPDSQYILVGRTQQLAATVRDTASRELNGRFLSWASSDSAIATISATGLVTGVAPGSARLSAAIGGVSDTVALTVGNLLVTIKKPLAGAFVGDTVRVRATVASIFQIATVTATLGAGASPMTYIPDSTMWGATLAITDVAFGAQQLRITASDVLGSARSAAIQVNHDPPPTITLTAPPPLAVASPSISLAVSCSDRNALACQSLTVRVSVPPASPSPADPILAAGTTSLNTTVSLAQYDGKLVAVRATGTDSAGQSTTVSREVWVLDTGFQRVSDVPGLVLDFDGARTLYAVRTDDSSDVVRIRPADGSEMTAFGATGRQVRPDKAFLMPAGALFVTTDSADRSSADALHEYRDGSASTLDSGSVSTLAVRDTFALWLTGLSGTPLYLRDLAAGQTTVVANDAGNTEYDVSAQGDVAYWNESYQVVYVPHGGGQATLTTGPLWNTYPRTDGAIVVYQKHTPCCIGQTYYVYMAPVTGGEMALTAASTFAPSPDRDYAVRGGWVAYTQQSPSGEMQVWSRSPEGSTKQVSYFGTSSSIEALDANGTIIFASQATRYRSTPPYTAVMSLGPAIGTVRMRAGRFVILLGGVVFAIP